MRALGIFMLMAVLQLFLYARQPAAQHNSGWPNIVLRNWHEAGYWKLGGQLVANAGGLEPNEKIFIYPGHRPYFLIPAYLLKELPGAMAGNGLLYDFTVLALTFGALLWLLGTGARGLAVASIVCLTPGFMNNVANVDTISAPGLLGIAAMSFAAGCLVRQGAGAALKFAGLAVMVLYMMLNWSTLFSLGVAAVYVVCKRRDWLKSAALMGVPLFVGMVVLYVSMHSRHAAGSTSGDFWNAYLWGPLGYDRTGMTLGKAFVRIMAVNSIAWLSLALAALALGWQNGLGAGWRRAPWPLLAGIAAVFALRNYNAHHPWNSVCIIGLGLIFSIELLTPAESQRAASAKCWLMAGTTVFAGVYLFAWLALDEYNVRGMTAVQTLVYEHTPRHALLVVADDLLPDGVSDYKAFAEEFDRKLVSLDEWNRRSGELAGSGKEIYLLTHATTPPATAKLIAQSQTRTTLADHVMIPLFDFYRSKISRRAPGNRKTYFDDYKLYQVF